MPTREYYLEQIGKELVAARDALNIGNDGKARVCARRAAGQAITWFISRNIRQGWGADAMNQLLHLIDDLSFPQEVRDAAVRLTTKISERFTYPFTTSPIEDARLIIDSITFLMDQHAD